MKTTAKQIRPLELSLVVLIVLLTGAGGMADARERNGQTNNHMVNCSKNGDRRAHGVRERDNHHRFSAGFHRFWNNGYIFNGPDWLRDTTFIYEGTSYFYYNGIYFTRIGNVFAATTPPFAGYTYNGPGADNTAYPKEISGREATDTITIEVPAGEKRVPVKLVRLDKGFVGPYGEFYPNSPTVNELKPIYGY